MDSWPHQFTRDGNPKPGPEGRDMQDMICVHCHTRYVYGLQPKPSGSCPARNTKREVKRIKNA